MVLYYLTMASGDESTAKEQKEPTTEEVNMCGVYLLLFPCLCWLKAFRFVSQNGGFLAHARLVNLTLSRFSEYKEQPTSGSRSFSVVFKCAVLHLTSC